MRRTLLAATAATLAFGFGQVKAEGFYASFSAGLNMLQESENDHSGTVTIDGPVPPLPFSPLFIPFSDQQTQTEHNLGFAIVGAIGYKFDNGVRVEGEISYRRNTPENVDLLDSTGASVFSFDGSGSQQTFAFMANALYEFDLTGGWHPYLGGGVGVALVNRETTLEFPGIVIIPPGDIDAVDDTDTVLAYQAIAGVAYDITDTVAIGVEYRFFGTASPSFEQDNVNLSQFIPVPPAPPGLGISADIDSETRNFNHSVMFTVRVGF